MIYLIFIAALQWLLLIGLYNSLVRKKNDVENAFASVHVILKKRYDSLNCLLEWLKI